MRASLSWLGALAALSTAFCVGCGGPDLVAPGHVAPDLAQAVDARAADVESGASEPTAGDLVLLLLASARQEHVVAAAAGGPSHGEESCAPDTSLTTPLEAGADGGLVATSPDPAPEAGDPRPRGDGSALCPMGFYAHEGRCEVEGSGLRLWGVAISPDPAPEKNK